jgi:hypothetical protein
VSRAPCNARIPEVDQPERGRADLRRAGHDERVVAPARDSVATRSPSRKERRNRRQRCDRHIAEAEADRAKLLRPQHESRPESSESAPPMPNCMPRSRAASHIVAASPAARPAAGRRSATRRPRAALPATARAGPHAQHAEQQQEQPRHEDRVQTAESRVGAQGRDFGGCVAAPDRSPRAVRAPAARPEPRAHGGARCANSRGATR